MANYYCTYRTNYFRVRDPEAFEALMQKVSGEDFHFWKKQDNAGRLLYGFGGYGNYYLENPDSGDAENYDLADGADDLFDALRRHIAPDDSIIIFESGHEKLRYVTGCATVITEFAIEGINIKDMAIDVAKKLLKNPQYDTETEY